MRLVLGVQAVQGEWLRVQLPIRPNGTTGWVKKADVALRTVPNHIVIEVQKRKLTAWKGSTLLLESPAGVGTPKTPTPEGKYYVDVSARNPGHGLGVHMLSVSGFSNVLRNFGGGTGQIAIHGTSNMATVGAFSSNGCIRLPNETITRLARIAPTGTPVFILP
jgi:lipoprotein-anchoring transpeptidase ErfK/SrfK